MAQEEKRSSARANARGSLSSAPYLAKIINHLDENFQCGLEVTLLRESGNQIGDENQTYIVKYASPFYGVTPYEFTGENLTYEDAQTSYGFWGVPPDPGVTGIVIFIDGQASQGFWLCSIQDTFQNHMIPAIAGTKNYSVEDDLDQAEHPLPVVEHNRKQNQLDKNLEVDKIERAVHPFAYVIKAQGLIRDEFRGTSTSSTRRDIPNMVFGMSSPGPLNRKGKKKFLGTRQSQTADPQPVNRLGGTQFVMDDGDDRYFREAYPTDGPPVYVPNPEGLTDVPYNEHFRIRTRTGHQILLHNSEDLIYIGNARGTAWVELTSDGKIDIFSADSINIRTKQDFNFYADRDFNLEVGRNLNIKVREEMHTHVLKDSILIVDENQKIHVKKDVDITYDKTFQHHVKEDVNVKFVANYLHKVGGAYDFNAGGHIFMTSGGSNETKAGGNIIETAPQIQMNGPDAASAAEASEAEVPKELKTHTLPDIASPSAKDDPVDLLTILRRVPTYEAYPHHENLNPEKFKPENLDRDGQGRNEGNSTDLQTPPGDWKKYKKPSDNPF
jgi:hypothetical protein